MNCKIGKTEEDCPGCEVTGLLVSQVCYATNAIVDSKGYQKHFNESEVRQVLEGLYTLRQALVILHGGNEKPGVEE